jgi:hypothetical protein
MGTKGCFLKKRVVIFREYLKEEDKGFKELKDP